MIEEIRGDRAGIGYRRVPADFTFRDMPLDLTDGEVVLHDDRRADRTGRRRTPPLLRSQALDRGHRALPGRTMAEQRRALMTALAQHQGEEQRRDDVTVIGFVPLAA